jgi:hypothetical protein
MRKSRGLVIPIMLAITLTIVAVDGPMLWGQTARTQDIMRQKLQHAEQLLAALVTSDWSALAEHSRQLEQLTNDPGWQVFMTPEYARESTAFLNAVQQLTAAAEQRDQTEASDAYTAVVQSCVSCHRYVAGARIAAGADRSGPGLPALAIEAGDGD